ncbi:secretory immunoglobulin A-binding protein EsiB [bacterium MnTg02]|nr:secretory immunoglobulin A-binding protein EsiB [bacterium MnTg02]
MRTTLLACVLSLCPVASGSAGPGEDGVSAFERGDYTAALWLWRPLAEKGNATAQYLIGHMYDRGLGVPQDDVMAVEWYRKAAEQGDASAQLKLGVRYAKGEGVPQDDAVAHKWLNLAASRYPASAVTWREKAIELREASATRMTPAQIAEAQRMAREWKPKKKRANASLGLKSGTGGASD